MNKIRRAVTNRYYIPVISVLAVLGAIRPQASASRAQLTTEVLSSDIQQTSRPEGSSDSKALFEHALDLEKGRGVISNAAEAIAVYKKAAALGNSDAALRLGHLYSNGMIIPPDLRESAFWYRNAAELGHPTGMFFLGTLYWSGRGVGQDLTEAYKWLSLATTHSMGMDQQRFALTRDSLGRVLSAERVAEAKRRGQEWEAALNAKKKLG